MSEIGIVAIGRNEGARLEQCLRSVVGRHLSIVYVDSASTDGSPALARQLGAYVIELDMSIPFSPGRARNEGATRLLQVNPHVKFIQFIDGDCEVNAQWIETAHQTLQQRPDAAVVCGRRRERYPEKTVYNALCDIEWNTPIGEANACGGDAMIRREAFEQAGGYNPTIVSGEEPELCQRLRGKGWKVLRIDAEMTLHDADMRSWRNWWRRAKRSGYGALDYSIRFKEGSDGAYVRHTRSAQFWTIGYVLLISQAIIFGSLLANWKIGLAAGLILAMILPLKMLHIAWRIYPKAKNVKLALVYGVLMMLGKWAYLAGQLQYRSDRAAGRNTRMIEYKQPGAPVSTVPGTH